jgi:transposase
MQNQHAWRWMHSTQQHYQKQRWSTFQIVSTTQRTHGLEWKEWQSGRITPSPLNQRRRNQHPKTTEWKPNWWFITIGWQLQDSRIPEQAILEIRRWRQITYHHYWRIPKQVWNPRQGDWEAEIQVTWEIITLREGTEGEPRLLSKIKVEVKMIYY